MAKTNWGLNDVVQPSDLNGIGQEINQLREDVDNIEIPPASLTEAGIVQLSNATNSNAEDRAATPKAVKSAYDAAVAAQTTANAANLAAAAAQAKADAAETPSGAQAKVNAAVGNLSTLLTSAKSNTVAAINELFTSASNGKTQIAAAITGKGVPASGSDTFSVLAQKIGQITTQHVMAPGDVPLFKSDKILLSQNSSYAMTFKINVGMPGIYRIKFKIGAVISGQTAYARLYKNGVAYGTERSTQNYQTPVTYSEDLAYSAGDTIELWTRVSGSVGYVTYYMPEVYGDVPQYIYTE